MSRFVVDASLAVKWFVAEIHADAAQRLQDPAHELHIPAFFDIEMANIAWKKLRRGELTRAEADFIINQLPLLPVSRHPDGPWCRPPLTWPTACSEPSTILFTWPWPSSSAP